MEGDERRMETVQRKPDLGNQRVIAQLKQIRKDGDKLKDKLKESEKNVKEVKEIGETLKKQAVESQIGVGELMFFLKDHGFLSKS